MTFSPFLTGVQHGINLRAYRRAHESHITTNYYPQGVLFAREFGSV